MGSYRCRDGFATTSGILVVFNRFVGRVVLIELSHLRPVEEEEGGKVNTDSGTVPLGVGLSRAIVDTRDLHKKGLGTGNF